MFTKQSDSFRKFAILVGRIRFIKKLLHPIYYKYLAIIEERRKKLFRKNDLFIPLYEEVFKTVLQRYQDDFRTEGAHSYDYKLERLLQ